ncbi:MAG: hypothetical protein JWM82_2655, partial [Myxococcales bacterium]|nr:hypothetical protein [Myxococcales bacterium]
MPQQLPSARGQSRSLAHRMNPAVETHAAGAWQVVEMAWAVETQQTAPAPHEAVSMQLRLTPESQVSLTPMQVGAWVCGLMQHFCTPTAHAFMPHGIGGGGGAVDPATPAFPATPVEPAAPVVPATPVEPAAPEWPAVPTTPAAPVV